jgi:dTDP-4-dehydrorhamnose 3,5-epimerase
MKIESTKLPGLLLLVPQRHYDVRGNFFESWNKETLLKSGIDVDFVQENQSLSIKSGTIRGLHFQAPPFAQDKLVRCISGSLFDVAVDFRWGSPTFGKWLGIELNDADARQLFIPKGFLHGYVTRSPNTEILYKCSNHYKPEAEHCIHFADTDIAINWGIDVNDAILSQKDQQAKSFAETRSPFSFSQPSELR